MALTIQQQINPQERIQQTTIQRQTSSQMSAQQQKLQSEIKLQQQKLQQKIAEVDRLREQAEYKSRTEGEVSNFLKNQLNQKAKEITAVQQRLNILRSSQSLQEAAQRQTVYQTQQIQKQFRQAEQKKKDQLPSGFETEAKRYESFGYTKTESGILAVASLQRGGMTFSPDYAQELLQTGVSTMGGIQTQREFGSRPSVSEVFFPKQEPYLTTRVTEVKEGIPTTEVIKVEPEAIAGIFPKVTKATKEETTFFRSQPKDLQAKTPEQFRGEYGILGPKISGRIVGGYERQLEKIRQSQKGVSQSITFLPTKGLEYAEYRTGLDLPTTFTEAQQNIRESSSFLREQGILSEGAIAIGEQISAIGVGGLKTVAKRPIEVGGILALSAGVGFAAGAGIGALSGVSVGAAKVATGGLITLGVAGAIPSVIGTSSQIIAEEDVIKRGEIIGESAVFAGAGLYGGFKGFKAGKRLFEPITITKPIKEPIQTFRETQVPAVKDGKLTTLKTLEIRGETKPPLLKFKTTRFKQFFDITPKQAEVIMPKQFLIKTPVPARGEEPFTVFKFVKGSKKADIISIRGGQQPIRLKTDISKLTNIEKLLLKRSAGVQDDLISEQTLTKFFGKGKTFQRNIITSEKQFRIDVGKKTLEVVPYGRRTMTTRAISSLEPVIETPKAELLKGDIRFKDISKPFARARGKTPRLTGEVFILKEPVVSTETPTKFIRPAQITKTPFSKTFQKVVTKQEPTTLAARVPKQILAKTVPLETIKTLTKTMDIPVLVRTKQQSRVKEVPTIKVKPQERTVTKSMLRPVVKLQERFLTTQKPKQEIKSIIKQQTKQVGKQIQKQQQKQIQKQILKQVLKTPGVPKNLLYPFRPTFPLAKPPSFDFSFKLGKRKRKFRKITQPTGYSPSLTGAVFRIRGKSKEFRFGYLPGIRGYDFSILKNDKVKKKKSLRWAEI